MAAFAAAARLLLCVAALCGAAAESRSVNLLDSEKIVNGVKVASQSAEAEKMPWMVSIRTPGYKQHYCGGSLISKNYVLTAAHCKPLVGDVIAVGWYYFKASQNHAGFQTTAHTVHCLGTVDSGDCCLIELKDEVPESYQVNGVDYNFTPIKLNFDADSWLEAPFSQSGSRTRATVAGWGYDQQDGKAPQQLMQVSGPIFPAGCCDNRNGFKYHVTDLDDTMFCMGGDNGEGKAGDACQGDSGGPLFIPDVPCSDGLCAVQIGVVSWGKGCGWLKLGYPGVYGRVSSFKEFILKTTGLSEDELTLDAETRSSLKGSDWSQGGQDCPAPDLDFSLPTGTKDKCADIGCGNVNDVVGCDAFCTLYGDCGEDYAKVCLGQDSLGDGTCTTCGCGQVDCGGCNCDALCTLYSDCCEDFYSTSGCAQDFVMPSSCNDCGCGSFACGNCACDSECQVYGDCCDDFGEACGEKEQCESCGCDDEWDSNDCLCACDNACTYFGDCCGDFNDVCRSASADRDDDGQRSASVRRSMPTRRPSA